MPEMRLRQPVFTCNACGPFTKKKERIKNLKKQEIQNTIRARQSQNELDKSCFQRDIAYEDFKDLPR